MSTLRLILGDQLSLNLPTLNTYKQGDLILMAEVYQEATYVKHHKKKIAFIFSAMRHYAIELEEHGYRVCYVKYNDPENSGSLFGEVKKEVTDKDFQQVIITKPGEYRLLNDFNQWQNRLNVKVELLDDTRFISSETEFSSWAKSRKQLVMEYWYRLMRKKTKLLMQDDQPIGGKWNYDKENRKKLKSTSNIKGPKKFKTDSITKEVLALVENEFNEHFGDLDTFWFAVTRRQANQALSHFIKHSLPNFGFYQDAMLSSEPFLFHSIISQYINCGLLDAMDVCHQVEKAYYNGDAALNNVEGFIRQIIGWREYIRGIYWLQMPDYAERNTLKANRPLPSFYWDGQTKMYCMSEVINTTRKEAHSHHIQRLMITGNFANLAGLDVKSVCEWYLSVYVDAYEWVELPNTLGMALFADDGVVATKPYVSSGAYINRMSDFCKHCQYDVRKKVGEDACPFTNLYWNYLCQHEDKLKKNHRMSISYRNLDRLSIEEKKQITSQAKSFLSKLK